MGLANRSSAARAAENLEGNAIIERVEYELHAQLPATQGTSKRWSWSSCYGPSGIAWPVLGGLAGQPSCELMGLGLALPGADETGLEGCL
jgi:hypothetical protein